MTGGREAHSSPGDVGRIAILVACMDPGGAERVALNLAEAFAAGGERVDLVLVRGHGNLLSQVPSTVRIVDLSARRAMEAVGPFRDYLRRVAPGSVLAVNFEMNLTALLAMRNLPSRTKLLLSVHCAPIAYFRCAPAWWRALMMLASRRLYRRADHVVAVSAGIAAELTALRWAEPDRIKVIFNPVIRGDLAELATGPADHPWFMDRSVPLIVTAGRLTPQKDQSLLLRAFARLAASRPARLALLGDGKLRNDLEAEAASLGMSERVAFLGHRENPYPYLRAADLFVLSSAWEGFGNVLVEAMGTGTPVVATDCPHGPREVLKDGAWGRLVAHGDVDALASAMSEALDEEPRLDPRARAADFTVEASANDYLGLIRGGG